MFLSACRRCPLIIRAGVRRFSVAPTVRQQPKDAAPQTVVQAAAAKTPADAGAGKSSASVINATHRVTAMDRRYLVLSGKFKNQKDIPDYIHPETMERANNQARIRICNIMILLTIIGCIGMVISGKKAVESGDSVTKQNLDWHNQYNKSLNKQADKKD